MSGKLSISKISVGLCALMVQGAMAADGQVTKPHGVTQAVFQAMPYTFAEAYRDALVNDARLAVVESQLKAQSEQVDQAEAQMGVQANVSATAGWQNYSRQGVSGSIEQTTSNETLTVSKPLYAPKNTLLIDQSVIRVDYAKLNLESKRVELGVRVSEAYLNALMAQESRKLSVFQLETATKNLAQVEEALKLGYSSKVDLFSAKAEVDDAKARVLADDLAVVTQKQLLQQIVGRPLPEQLPMLTVSEMDLSHRFLSNHDWLMRAKQKNLDLQLSNISVDLARKELDVRRSENKPQVQLGWQYGQSQGGSSYTTGENQYLYMQLSMPVYDSGYNASRKREAEALVQSSEQEKRVKELEIEKQVQELLANLESTKERLIALRQAIVSGEAYLELSEESYRLGLRNLIEVQRAKEKLYANQRDLLKTSMSMVSYLCQLYAVSAQLDENWVSELSRVLWQQK